jgi:hypothetical protein
MCLILWKIMKAVKLLILLIFTPMVLRGECNWRDILQCPISLYVDGWSHHHVNNDDDYNEQQQTKGIGIGQFHVIAFRNSFNESGRAAFVNGPLLRHEYFSLGLLFMLVRGYSTDPLPVMVPYFKFGIDPMWVNASCLPTLDGTGQFICGFILEVKLQ